MNQSPLTKHRRAIAKSLAVIGVIFVFVAGIFAGRGYELSRHKLNLGDFWNVYNLIEERYAGTVDQDKAVDGAIHGLVESLEDPYSGFLSRTERQDLDDELRGEFEGIGAELTTKDNQITVVSALSNTPAERAGLKSSDVIVQIDGQSTEKMTLTEAVSKIRGERGTKVKLTVVRAGLDKPLDLEITRENIRVESVTMRMIDQVAYIEIRQFGDDTVSLAQKAAESAKDKKAKAIVLDLRNNPGGYLNSVPPIAGLFLPPSVIVIQKDKNGGQETLRSTDVPLLPQTPLYVLINNGSASASEILAGALQDHARAKVLGTKSFGKGSVQDLIPLSGGSALRLTIAEWLTPKGRSINKEGIVPDVVIEGERTPENDPVLSRALEIIKSEVK